MTYRLDSLVPLLFPPPVGDFGYHTGVIQTWNKDTGQNTVDIAGTTITDVPILNISDAIQLSPGHVVAVLRWKSTYFILGRITVPGQTDFASAAVAFDTINATASGVAVGSTLTQIMLREFIPPSWATDALVSATADFTYNNSSGAFVNIEYDVHVENQSSGTLVQSTNNGRSNSISATMGRDLNIATETNGDIDVEVFASADRAIQLTFVRLHAFAIYRSSL